MTSKYLLNLHKKPQTRIREIITKVKTNNLQKIIEARGEHQTTQYSTSNPLNTS